MSLRTKESGEKYVDIHGREIPAVIVEETDEIAFPLSELRQTGVAVYQRSQYAKLATVEKKFDDDFYDHMLESAKNYMLMNKISFSEDQIFKSINNCKKLLSEHETPTTPVDLFRDRLVAEKPDHEISIKIPNGPSTSRSPQPPKTTPHRPKVTPSKHKSSNFDKHKINGVDSKPKEANTRRENGERKEGGPKLRPPKTNLLEKVALGERKNVDHDVIVTFCEKRNCIWVRDKANSDIFETLFQKLQEETKYQKNAPKPWQFEKVYLAEDDGLWFRCKVMIYSPLTVFFLDYGNMAEVHELKEISEKFAKIPCLAVRLTFKETEYVPNLLDELKIRILKQNDDGTYFVTVLSQSKKESAIPLTNGLIKNEEKPKPPLRFTRIPPPLCALENGQTVAIIHVEDGDLFMRTKQCYEKLREVEKACEEYSKVAPSCENYQVNQLVLVRDDSGKYCRAVVKTMRPNEIEVQFLDYVKKVKVDSGSLKNISESLSLVPVTYFQGQNLKGFHSGVFSEEAKNLILDAINRRQKYTVIVDTNRDFDLFDGSHKLSELLQESENENGKIRLQDLKRFEPELGVKVYMCSSYKDANDLKLVPKDEFIDYADSIMMQDINDPTPYAPVVGEVCFCHYDGTWYRCVVTRVLNKEHEVLLLDFGNVELIKKGDFRKPTEEFAKIPALALPCRLIDLPDHPDVHDLLKKLIIEEGVYNVEVKGISDGKWNVTIAAVYQQIEKTPIEDF